MLQLTVQRVMRIALHIAAATDSGVRDESDQGCIVQTRLPRSVSVLETPQMIWLSGHLSVRCD